MIENSTIKVSVILPTYNRKRELEKCLNSFLCQDAPLSDFEIIVIDDGSTDDTEQLFTSSNGWQPLQLVYYKQTRNGVSSARNAGIKIAKGKILAFIDSDCLANKDWIKNIMFYHEKFPDIAAIHGRTEAYSNNDYTAITEQKIIDRYLDYLILSNGEHKFINTLYTCNCSVKTGIFTRLKCSFSKEMFTGQDVDLARQILQKGEKIIYIDDIVAKHKNRTNFFSYMRRSFRSGRGEYLLRAKWRKDLRDYETKEFRRFIFARDLFCDFSAEHKLMGIAFFIIYLSRKMLRLAGYEYEKIKRSV